MNELTFNGVQLSDFNCFWDGSQIWKTPTKDVTFYDVVGRNGALSISNERFNNLELDVNCFIRDDFRKNYNDLINFLYSVDGYARFECADDPEVYRMAQFVSQIEPNTGPFLESGLFTLTFNCKPQKWLKSGENAIFISSSKTLINPTSQKAFPLIEVIGTGTITINDSVLTLANNTSKTYIDCEIQDCYEGSINRNPDLTIIGGFPVLQKTNTITVKGCTINLYPRWWKL